MKDLEKELFKLLVKVLDGYDNHKVYKYLRSCHWTAINAWWYEKRLIEQFG